MPNRIIKESIRTSYEINELSPDAEVSFYRLLTYADDYGRFPSDIRILQSQLFPLKASVRSKDFDTWVSELVNADLVRLYIGDDNKPYGFFPTWEDHQNIRNQRSKYPEPEGDLFESLTSQLKAIDNRRNQLKSTDINCTRESNPIQSESESKHIDQKNQKTGDESVKKKYSPSSDDVESIYQAYPRKVGKGKALEKIEKALIHCHEELDVDDPVSWLYQKTDEYANSDEGKGLTWKTDLPHPATWYHQLRYLDDPSEWKKKETEKVNNERNGINRKSKGDRHVEFLTS